MLEIRSGCVEDEERMVGEESREWERENASAMERDQRRRWSEAGTALEGGKNIAGIPRPAHNSMQRLM